LLLTILAISPDRLGIISDGVPNMIIPALPSRLKTMDNDALHILNLHLPCLTQSWTIFRDFLNSGHPQALGGQRYATAALAFLEIIFKNYHARLPCFLWLGQHSRTLRVTTQQHSQKPHTDLPSGTDWKQSIQLYWQLRMYLPTRTPQKMPKTSKGDSDSDSDEPYSEFPRDILYEDIIRWIHLRFLLEKSAHSDNILNFARCRVFRFGYLNRKHPKYIKKAIFTLAKYIQRVTGETAEVRACESIWGRDRWFTAN
jgi:hypothetical protein